jgi:two-component system KDP operon response regulator KdpE
MTTSQPTALVIEDEPHIRRFVRAALEHESWRVYEASTMARGLAECGTRKPTLVLLDLGLPDGDGLALLRDLRTWSKTPVIVISARSSENQKIAALDAGADDYLTKPFGIGELLARVRVAMRRSVADPGETRIAFGNVEIDLNARTVRKAGRAVHLTPIEYRLLTLLVAHAGTVMTHRQLLLQIWGPSHVERSHYLRIYMGALRNKLEDDPARPQHLVTITAVGYRFDQTAA